MEIIERGRVKLRNHDVHDYLKIIEAEDNIMPDPINDNFIAVANKVAQLIKEGITFETICKKINADYRIKKNGDVITETVSVSGKELAKCVTTVLANGNISCVYSGAVNFNEMIRKINIDEYLVEVRQ